MSITRARSDARRALAISLLVDSISLVVLSWLSPVCICSLELSSLVALNGARVRVRLAVVARRPHVAGPACVRAAVGVCTGRDNVALGTVTSFVL